MTIHSIFNILLVFVFGIVLSCNGQVSPESKTVHLDKVVSELDNRIWAILQDSKGVFWFGSNGNGIYRYDEENLIQFTEDDGLVHNQIRGIQEDNKGNIYIETPVGVSRFNGSKFETMPVLHSPNSQWKNDPNDLWFNCNGNSLYRFDGDYLHELQLPAQDLTVIDENFDTNIASRNYSPYSVFGLNRDKDGNVWIGTVSAGAFRYDGKTMLWIGEKELSTLPDGREPGVRAMVQDKSGYFWLSNFRSKYKVDPDLDKGYEKIEAVDLFEDTDQIEELYFNSAITDYEGIIWATTFGGGVWKYNGETLVNFEVKNGQEDALLICVYQSHDGTIWLGSNNDGVYKQNVDTFEKFEISQ